MIRLEWRDRSWGPDALEALVQDAVEVFRRAGLTRGHHVGLITSNAPLYVIALRACRESGLVLVPFSPGLPSAMLRDRAKRVRIDVWIAERDEAERARRIVSPSSLAVAAPDGTDWSPVENNDARPVRKQDRGTRAVLFTSGTTGPAQAWGYDEEVLAAHAKSASKRIAFDDSSVALGVLPLHHAGGFMLLDRVLRFDGRLVLEDRFDPERLARLMQTHDVTHVSLVPVMFSRLLEVLPQPPPSLRCVLLGGDAVPKDLLEKACEGGWPVFVSYGLTETCSQVATATPEQACAEPATAGFPLEGVELWIRGDDGTACAAGVEGEIRVGGKLLAKQIGSHEGLKKDGLATQDRGYLDEEGKLFVTGRAIERIVTGGHTVNAREVEAVLESYPGVGAACVVGLPDAEWGQQVAAVLVPDEEEAAGPLDEDALITHARKRLPAHAIPRRFLLMPTLTRTSLGKKHRVAARNLLMACRDSLTQS